MTNDAPSLKLDNSKKWFPLWDYARIKELVAIVVAGELRESRVEALQLVGSILGDLAEFNKEQPTWALESQSSRTKTLGGVCEQISFVLEAEDIPADGRPTHHFAFLVRQLCCMVIAEAM